MARHSGIDELQPAGRNGGPAGRGRRRRWSVLLVCALAAVALTAPVLLVRSQWSVINERLATAPLVGAECPSTRREVTGVSMTVAPEIAQTVQRIVNRVDGRELSDGSCLDVTVSAQEPAQTVAGAAFLPADRAPDLWIPDSSIWTARLERWKAERIAGFAASPIVIASSRSTIERQGWQAEPPTWQEALAGTAAVSAPEITENASSMIAMLALVQSMNGRDDVREALAAAVLATKRSGVDTVSKALAAAQAGAADAPLIPLSEQAVLGVAGPPDAGTGSGIGRKSAKLTVVYPRGAAAVLDYPLLEVRRADEPVRRQAASVVQDALTSDAGQALVRDAGLRAADGTPPEGVPSAGRAIGRPQRLPTEQLAALVQQIGALAAPTRLLAVVDISASMAAPAGNGMSRTVFAAAAAKTTGTLLPDVAQVGVWGFSRDVDGTKNWLELERIAGLGAPAGGSGGGGRTHRDAVYAALDAMPSRLEGNGTAVYATTVAAMKFMQRAYEPDAANAVVVMTDGSNEDPGGPTLRDAVQQIRAVANPGRPVRLVMVGIGPEADLPALQQLAAPTGGAAYRLRDPRELPKVLLRTMSQRPQQ